MTYSRHSQLSQLAAETVCASDLLAASRPVFVVQLFGWNDCASLKSPIPLHVWARISSVVLTIHAAGVHVDVYGQPSAAS